MNPYGRFEYFITEYWGYAIKYFTLEIETNIREDIIGFRLSTLILKHGYRNNKVGSAILMYLKRRCDDMHIYLIVPFGVTHNPERLRNFYKRNGLTQMFNSDGFEYFTYNIEHLL